MYRHILLDYNIWCEGELMITVPQSTAIIMLKKTKIYHSCYSYYYLINKSFSLQCNILNYIH